MSRVILIICLWIGGGSIEFLGARDLRTHTLIVYNKQDSESESLAREYAKLREISPDRIFGLSCSVQEEISRKEYTETIENPLNDFLVQKKWILRYQDQDRIDGRLVEIQRCSRNDVWVMVLMRGIPLKIADDPGIRDFSSLAQHFQTNGAAVDSELAMLPNRGLPKTGPLNNPIFHKLREGGFDLLDSDQMILVGRLDAPTPSIVRRMMRESYEVEQKRLCGRVALDLRGFQDPKDPYFLGDQWLQKARELFLKEGFWVDQDIKPDLFPSWLPWGGIALYLGWYSGNAEGPFMKNSVFTPGAIAYHIHSSSAHTLRSTTQNWVGPLLDRGAVATMGAVYEPYLQLTPEIDVFAQELLRGMTFIEAAYASQRGLSWMVTMVGDPLYRPFKNSLETDLKNAQELSPTTQSMYLELQNFLKNLRKSGGKLKQEEVESIRALILKNGDALEILADVQSTDSEQLSSALDTYLMAKNILVRPLDQIRLGCKIAKKYSEQGRWRECFTVLEEISQKAPSEFMSYGGVQTLKQLSGRPEAPAVPSSLIPYLKQETGVLYEW